MKAQEICQKAINGEIKIDKCGHTINDPTKKLKEWLERTIEMANGKNDGKWDWDETKENDDNRTREQKDADMRKYFQTELDWEAESFDSIILSSVNKHYCFGCGREMEFVYNPETNAIELRRWYNPDKKRKKKTFGSIYGDYEIDMNQCEFEKLQSYSGQIEVTSSLIFTNFFRLPDAPKKERYKEKWSLNSVAGRYRIAEYKEKNYNIAYGQLGNTTLGVYVHPNKNSIIVGNAYIGDFIIDDLTKEQYDALTEKEIEELSKIEGHVLKGTVCCDVWRFEAGDKDHLGCVYEELMSRGHADVVEVKCKPGTWSVTHSYPRYTNEENPIWAKFEKTKKETEQCLVKS